MTEIKFQLQPEDIRFAVPEGRRRVAPGFNQGSGDKTDSSPVGAAAPYVNAPSPLRGLNAFFQFCPQVEALLFTQISSRPILYAKGVVFQSPGSANDVVVSATLGHIGRSPFYPEGVVQHCVVEPFQGSGLCGHLTQCSSQSLADYMLNCQCRRSASTR